MKRALILAAPAVLALGLVACSDDDDDSPDATTEETTDDTTSTDDTATDDRDDTDDTLLPGGTVVPGGTLVPGGTVLPGGTLPTIPEISIPDISIPDAEEMLGQIFPNLDEDQIDCLAEEVGPDIDVSQVMDVLDECNIDPADLQPGG